MSGALVPIVQTYLRGLFDKREVPLIDPYGGEFSAAELGKVTLTCPAILITCMGWEQAQHQRRMTGRGVRKTSMGAFVLTRHARRADRMAQAQWLAERVTKALEIWRPECPTDSSYELAALDEDPRAENLYGRAIDSAGLALWLVRWDQCMRVHGKVPAPALYDLTRVEITDHTHQGTTPPAPTPGGVVPTVSEDVQFLSLPPQP